MRAKGVYDDLGPSDENAIVRAVVGLRVRDRTGLDALAQELSDPTSATFRRFLSSAEVAARFLPTEDDVANLRRWAAAHGFTVSFVSSNHLFVELAGPAHAYDEALTTTVHAYRHRTRSQRVYGTPSGIHIPTESGFDTLLSLDEPARSAEGDDDEPDTTDAASSEPKLGIGYFPAQIARAYQADTLAARTDGGRGATIALAIGGGFHDDDAAAFWSSTNVERAPAAERPVGGAPSFRGLENTMLVEWAGALAPNSQLLVYQGQDSRTSSILLAFDEAIAGHEANVVTFSHSRYESSEPAATRAAYDLAAELGAVTGVTVVAASGDTAEPDVPATCPFVTAVGGTMLFHDDGETREEAWGRSGSGRSSFDAPRWQRAVVTDAAGHRAVPDLALNAGIPYLIRFEGSWRAAGGSSLAAPVFASIVALVDAGRFVEGKPPIGFLNPALYGDAEVQRAFRDVTVGGTREHAALPGWDYPSGWGAPLADAFAQALH